MESDDGYREFIGGLPDGAEVTFGLNFLAANATQTDLLTNLADQTDTGAYASTDVIRHWRMVFVSSATSSYTATVVTTTWTTATHGWNTGQPVYFGTTGTLPSNVTAGVLYYIRRLGSATFSLHPTSADATANTNAISSSGGSGTHTVYSGGSFLFDAFTIGYEPNAEIDDKVGLDVTLKITGDVSI
jgi:hypothetical protein